MKKKGIIQAIFFCITVFLLAGCGSTTNASDEQLTAISEYAAIMLLKYDANNRSRLVDEATIEEADRRKEAWEEAGRIEPTPTPDSGGMRPVDDTTVIENTDKESNQSTCSSLNEYFANPDGIDIEYTGYELCDSYAQERNDYFALEAADGKKLLVLKFQLQNTKTEAKEVELFSKKAVYRILINDEYVCSAMRTILMNDISTYVSKLAGQSSEEVVLVTEIEEALASSIHTMELYMKDELNTYTIKIM